MKPKNQMISFDPEKISKEEIPEEVLAWLKKLGSEDNPIWFPTEQEGMAIIGNILKKLRSQSGLSQAEIGSKIGYKRFQFISNVERGVAKIPFQQAKKFADAYGGDVKLLPAIIRLLHHDTWDVVLDLVQIAGADCGTFDYEVETWIRENK